MNLEVEIMDPAELEDLNRSWPSATDTNDSGAVKCISSVISCTGRTPLVETQRIHQVIEGRGSRIHIKLEYKNPTRSIMDRIALKVIESVETTHQDLVKRGTTLVTSGDADFSIAVGLICAVKGYRTLAFIPSHTTPARKQTLKSYGVKVSLVPESTNASKMYETLAANLCASLPGSVNLNKFISSELVNSVGTEIAGELQDQLSKPPHVFVGEKDGLGIFNSIVRSLLRKLSEKTRCRMVQVTMDTPQFLKQITRHENLMINDDIVGIETVAVSEKDAFGMTRKFIAEEGIWCGPRGGSLLAGAIQSLQRRPLADESPEPVEILLLLNECLHSGDKAFLSNEWMLEKEFFTQIDISRMKWWDAISLSNLRLKSVPLIDKSSRVVDVLRLLEDSAASTGGFGVVVDQSTFTSTGEECIKGLVNKDAVTASLKNGRLSKDDLISLEKPRGVPIVVSSDFGRIPSDGNLGDLEKLLDLHRLVVVYKATFKVDGEGRLKEIHVPCGIATQVDVLQWISGVMDHHRMQSQWGVGAKTVFDEPHLPISK